MRLRVKLTIDGTGGQHLSTYDHDRL